MELNDLLTYAEETWQIKEEHPWAEWPGFSVLAHPDTGKWIALCMRQWDEETGELIEAADLKCEQRSIREFHVPYVTFPFRMKGSHWAGIRFGYGTDAALIRKLFDRAVTYGRPGGYTVVLGSLSSPSGASHRDTPLPVSGRPYRNEGNDVPEKISQMRKLSVLTGDMKTLRDKTFYLQARFMEDYEDEGVPYTADSFRLFTTYRNLSTRQLRGYFSWRTQLRKGIFEPVPVSAAYLYSFELLNGIGASDAEDRLKKLRAFADILPVGDANYGYDYAQLHACLEEWIVSLGILLGVKPEVLRKYAGPASLNQDIMLERLKNPREYPDEDIAEALQYFAGKKLNHTPVLGTDPKRGAALFAESWRIGTETEFDGRKNLFRFCFGDILPRRWYPLVNAVYYEQQPPEDREYRFNAVHSYYCRNGIWMQDSYNLRFAPMNRFAGFVHAADCRFRRYLKTGRYLKEKPEEAWALGVIEAAIRLDQQAVQEASRPKISIDLSGLDRIRNDADITRTSLLTEAELQSEPSVEELPEAGQVPAAEEIPVTILRGLLKGEDVQTLIRQKRLMPSVIADTINERFYEEIGDTVVLCENDILHIVEDYREDLEMILGGADQ